MQKYGDLVPDVLPRELTHRLQMMEEVPAMRQIHFPDSAPALEAARRRLVFDELFLLQTALAKRKHALGAQLPGIPLPAEAGGADRADGLPAIHPDRGRSSASSPRSRPDMALPRPMNRLLQGDVGSGKTVVAAAAILSGGRAGYQAALMVPTEILAEQHYSRAGAAARAARPAPCAAWSAACGQKGKRLIKEETRDGQADSARRHARPDPGRASISTSWASRWWTSSTASASLQRDDAAATRA